MELYVFSALAGLGYLLHNRRKAQQERRPSKIGPKLGRNPPVDPREVPSVQNPYHADRWKQARQLEMKAARQAYQKAQDPRKTGVVARNMGENVTGTSSGGQRLEGKFVKSPLTDQLVPVEHFMTNDKGLPMVPFFGAKVTQNMNHDTAGITLDRLNGPTNLIGPKREIQPMFEPQMDVDNVFGNPNQTDKFLEHIPRPQARNNEFPIEQVRVGPGICSFDAEPQIDSVERARELVKPKTTDELRTADNPKISYKGRTIPGQKGSKRGKFPEFSKNRQSTVTYLPEDTMLPSKAATSKQKKRPRVILKDTTRPDTHVEYSGPPHASIGNRKRAKPSSESHRQNLPGPQFNPATATDRGKGAKHDYGKGSIQIYENERSTTGTRTHQSNVTSMVKALIAPLQDVMRASKKEYMIDAPSNETVQPQIPSKPTVHDPNDVPKTTIKETSLHDTHGMGSLRPVAQKTPVYDPDAVARTTIKETTSDAIKHGSGNIKGGAIKSVVYDPDSIARTTVRETTSADGHKYGGNIVGGAYKGTVYDPNQVARTTTKQTTSVQTPQANLSGGPSKGVVYDPDSVARTTLKETTLTDGRKHGGMVAPFKKVVQSRDPDARARTTLKEVTEENRQGGPTRNVRPARYVGTVHDPDDVAKTTMKQLIAEQEERPGNVEALEGRKGGYESANYTAPHTQKEVMHREYTGVAHADGTGAYEIAQPIFVPRDTQRQTLSANDYYGSAEGAKAMMSYQDIYNATVNETKELTLQGREPTLSSTKVAAGPESVNLQPPRNPLPNDFQDRIFRNPEPPPGELLDPEEGIGGEVCVPSQITREPNAYANISQERLDTSILDPLKSNPFAIRFHENDPDGNTPVEEMDFVGDDDPPIRIEEIRENEDNEENEENEASEGK